MLLTSFSIINCNFLWIQKSNTMESIFTYTRARTYTYIYIYTHTCPHTIFKFYFTQAQEQQHNSSSLNDNTATKTIISYKFFQGRIFLLPLKTFGEAVPWKIWHSRYSGPSFSIWLEKFPFLLIHSR